ncbi:MAG TPA: hypothetical protein VKZ61_12345 [Thermomicrobiales bacterium]|nr:hypothetical protein [Thermomicrobiales bacterium]
MVYDGGLGRVSIFSSSGEFGRSIRPGSADNGSFPDIIGRFVDGTFLAKAYNLDRLTVSVTSTIKDSSTFYLYSPTGVQDRKIGNFLNDDIFLLLGQNGRMIERIWMVPPFARRTQIALDQDRFYAGEAERFEIAQYSASGSLVRIIRLANASRPVTEAAIDQYRQAQL